MYISAIVEMLETRKTLSFQNDPWPVPKILFFIMALRCLMKYPKIRKKINYTIFKRKLNKYVITHYAQISLS